MRSATLFLASVLFCTALAVAQQSECASVARKNDGIVLTANFWDPVYSLSKTLADLYGVSVSVESPEWSFPCDAEDVALSDPQFSAQHHNTHDLVMKPHIVRIHFSAAGDAPPRDVHRLLLELASSANKALPYAYRLDSRAGDYALVPTKTRNSAGELEEVRPLLDHRVKISPGVRPIAEHAKLMADELSRQTGLHITCCQGFIAGVPWGQAVVPFQADDERARDVLRQLIQLEQRENAVAGARHPPYNHWMVECDGTGSPWCAIEVRGIFGAECREFAGSTSSGNPSAKQ
jgi:hypothetical protein